TWTSKQHYGFVLSIQRQGYWYINTESIDQTREVLRGMEGWLRKDVHRGTQYRPKLVDKLWGVNGNRSWGSHLLQGFTGIGPAQAEAIVDHFGGVPLQWTVTEDDLQLVKGIGKKRARNM